MADQPISERAKRLAEEMDHFADAFIGPTGNAIRQFNVSEASRYIQAALDAEAAERCKSLEGTLLRCATAAARTTGDEATDIAILREALSQPIDSIDLYVNDKVCDRDIDIATLSEAAERPLEAKIYEAIGKLSVLTYAEPQTVEDDIKHLEIIERYRAGERSPQLLAEVEALTASIKESET